MEDLYLSDKPSDITDEQWKQIKIQCKAFMKPYGHKSNTKYLMMCQAFRAGAVLQIRQLTKQ